MKLPDHICIISPFVGAQKYILAAWPRPTANKLPSITQPTSPPSPNTSSNFMRSISDEATARTYTTETAISRVGDVCTVSSLPDSQNSSYLGEFIASTVCHVRRRTDPARDGGIVPTKAFDHHPVFVCSKNDSRRSCLFR